MLLLLHLPAPGGGIQELQVELDAGFLCFFAYHDEPWCVFVGAIADRYCESLAVLHCESRPGLAAVQPAASK